ncbi:protein Osi24 [Cochliomyia hominivorax]
MKKTLLIAKDPSKHKMCKRLNKSEMTTVTSKAEMTMTPTNKFNNIKNIIRKTLNENKCWAVLQSQPCWSNTTPINTNTNTKTSHSISVIINRMRYQKSFALNKQQLWLMLWLLMTLILHVESLEMTTRTYRATQTSSSAPIRYSQLLSTNGQITMSDNAKSIDDADDDTFRPFVPKDMELVSRNVFTPSGQFRVFQPIDTDLRAAVALQSKNQYYGRNKLSEPLNTFTETTSSLAPSPSLLSPTKTTTITTTLPSATPAYVDTQEKQQISRKHKNTMSHQPRTHDRMVYQTDSSKLSQTTTKQNRLEQQQQQQLHHTITTRKTHEIKHDQEHKPKNNEHNVNLNILENNNNDVERNEISKKDDDLTSDLKSLEDLLVDYVTNFFKKGQYEPIPGLVVELHNNHSQTLDTNEQQQQPTNSKTRKVRQTAATDAKVKIDLPRTMATGRLLFLTGLKKILWPVFMGLQVLKSLLIAMFIPAIIGSFTKLLGKGISSGSAPLFIRPMEPPQELDFRDNSLNFEDDNKFLITDDGIKGNGPYAYNQPDASQINNEYVFDPSPSNNPISFTRLGMNERQHQLMQDSYMSALQSIGSASFKNSGSLSSGSSGLVAPMAKKPPPAANVNTFQQFQNVPDSSLLLSNYDPFYSPLLSRLDSVFAQLKINSDKEMCREKLICLMYANPAKYAPYSNLVSAQLSRELNELRKPTSDNPDILRFFKYMRAAKDGQDGVDCEQTFDKCTEFKDFENPAMVSTYIDINKLVQARKLTNK